MSDLLLDLGLDSTPPAPTPTEAAGAAPPSFTDELLADLAGPPSPLAGGAAQPRLEIHTEATAQVASQPDLIAQTPPVTPNPTTPTTPEPATAAPPTPTPTPTTPTTTETTTDGDAKKEEKEVPEVEEKKAEPIIPLDATHQELVDTFGGRWRMVRSDPYNEYLKVVGVGLFTRNIAGKGTPELSIYVTGQDTISLHLKSTFHTQIYRLKLGEETENLVEKTRQSVFCSYKDGKMSLNMTPQESGWGKVQEVELRVAETGEVVMIYTAGSAVCRRYFAKVPEVGVTPPTPPPPQE